MKILERGTRVVENGILVKTDTIGQCECGEQLALIGFTNTCVCGRDYNWAGQQLAPRSQWGEETGETASDILNCDYEGFSYEREGE